MAEVNADLVKRLAELVDGDQWQVADLLVDAFPLEEWESNDSSGRNGIRAVLDQYEHTLLTEHGIELKATWLRKVRATGLAWPRGARAPGSFTAHSYLLGEDRRERMDRYLKKNGGRPLTSRAVRRFRSEEKPAKAPPPWEQQVRKRIESAAKKALLEGIVTDRPDWWNVGPVTFEQRMTVISVLHGLANEMAGRS